jgi:1-aminocyclopropane-1-carboxylate deaminase/D-cysteine desulfhydrase-like pyridoxal-dependent ACC family enzyme
MNERERKLIFEKLDRFPRLTFGFYPTPLEELKRLREKIGKHCPRIFIKRDDYTGFGFGGNKIRKLEYVFARLAREGVEAVVTTGGERSNHARATAAFCARLGIECHLALDQKPRPRGAQDLKPAAIFLEEMFGARVYPARSIEERNCLADEISARLRGEGRKVARIPLGGALPEAALGFVRAIGELKTQVENLKIDFDRLVFSSSTGGTHAGMILGKRLFDFDNLTIVGVAPEPEAAEVISETGRLLRETSELLNFPSDSLDEEIEITGDYAGTGYCVETAEANRTLKLLAETEGVVLDPVYTAKAFAALLDWIEKGRLTAENNVLFWHTGGQPTLFYCPD